MLNLVRRIENPLAHLSREELSRYVDDFAAEQGMTDIVHLLQRGALVAQNPPNFEEVEDLEPHERDALRNEISHKWRQPRALYLTVILCSVGAAVQ